MLPIAPRQRLEYVDALDGVKAMLAGTDFHGLGDAIHEYLSVSDVARVEGAARGDVDGRVRRANGRILECRGAELGQVLHEDVVEARTGKSETSRLLGIEHAQVGG